MFPKQNIRVANMSDKMLFFMKGKPNTEKVRGI